MVRDAGFEPAGNPCCDKGSSGEWAQIEAQRPALDAEGQEVSAAWPDLPHALRAAVLAIVRSVGPASNAGFCPAKTDKQPSSGEDSGVNGGSQGIMSAVAVDCRAAPVAATPTDSREPELTPEPQSGPAASPSLGASPTLSASRILASGRSLQKAEKHTQPKNQLK